MRHGLPAIEFACVDPSAHIPGHVPGNNDQQGGMIVFRKARFLGVNPEQLIVLLRTSNSAATTTMKDGSRSPRLSVASTVIYATIGFLRP